MNIGSVTPILRSFDEARARDFYVRYLGFEVLFEHRFEPGLPLYLGHARHDRDRPPRQPLTFTSAISL